jgi:hypothetical protein
VSVIGEVWEWRALIARPLEARCNAELLTLNMACTTHSASITPRYKVRW